jgi:hypothetical protein
VVLVATVFHWKQLHFEYFQTSDLSHVSYLKSVFCF